jgi:hypothetical protein
MVAGIFGLDIVTHTNAREQIRYLNELRCFAPLCCMCVIQKRSNQMDVEVRTAHRSTSLSTSRHLQLRFAGVIACEKPIRGGRVTTTQDLLPRQSTGTDQSSD